MEMMRMREPQRPSPEQERLENQEKKKNAERARLIAVLVEFVMQAAGAPNPPTSPGEDGISPLERLLMSEPQRDRDGHLRYLLTSGLAVELITGFQRFHHDIDFVIMDSTQKKQWDLIGTDNVTPGKYWADMHFEPEFLETTLRTVRTRRNGEGTVVDVVHPGIIMVQKSSDAFGRPPRKRDNDDVFAIVGHWRTREGFTRDWNPIVRRSIDALPPQSAPQTLARVRRVLR